MATETGRSPGGTPQLRLVAEGTVRPYYSMFLVLAGEFRDDSPYEDEVDLSAALNSGATWLLLRSAGRDHRAQVRVELWSGEPPTTEGWDFVGEAGLLVEWEQIEVTDFEIVQRDAVALPVEPGRRLIARVQSRGGSDVAEAEAEFSRWLSAQDDASIDYANVPLPTGVERWLIQLWPALV